MKKKRLMALALCAGLIMTGCGASGGTGNLGESTVDSYESGENGAKDALSNEDNKVEEKKIDKFITVDYENRIKTNDGIFEGFGTALCWWANRIGYSDKLAQDAADLFYGEDGLRFNILRYNIGGGDDPTHHHITRTDSEVPGWLVDDGSGNFVYDYNADARQLNVLKRCYEAATNPYVEVFSNSAPYFMTESGCTGGAVDPAKNNLKPEYYTAFGEYLASVSEYINNDLGIEVKAVSPINEPDTNYWGANSVKQEGCHSDPGEVQSSIIVETAKAFDAHGLEAVQIAASDETSPVLAYNSYKQYTDEARKEVDRISTHTYSTNGIKSLAALQKNDGFNLWMSEVDGDGHLGKDSGEMGSALYAAQKIMSDINDLNPSAWVMWQVIDNHISKDGFNGNKDSGMVNVNSGFWGAAVCNHDKEEIILTQKYYGIGQITRYINAGDNVIPTGNTSSMAAYDKDTKTLTIVAMSYDDTDKLFEFTLKGFDIKGKASVIRTSGSMENGEHWDLVDEFSGADWDGTYLIKGYSVNTIVIEDVELN